jgi:CheY-like chemotaxis protein
MPYVTYANSLDKLTYLNSNNNNGNCFEHVETEDHQGQGETQRLLQKRKILVVEDNLINQKVAKCLLEGKGYQVEIAPTGQTALELYQTNNYSIILMDLGLPDMPGTEVTRQIRMIEQAKSSDHIPIVALTANSIEAKPACLASGMDDFSVKPFEIDRLDQLIQIWIGNSK